MALDPRARRSTKQARRADGVTIAPAPGARKPFVWLVAAAALVLLAAIVWSGPPRTQRVADAAAPVATRAEPTAAPAPQPSVPRRALHPVRVHETIVEDRPTPAPSAPEAETAPAADAPDVASVPSGIGLFPPPGTDPPKIGIVVPDDFPLPEGYLRHYQVTDDGNPLPAILMFHPDYDWVDENGNHVEVSPDGVVPPELAPKDLPIEMLELPKPEQDENRS